MRTRLVNMGNSRGVRLPKPLIAEAGLVDEVEVHVRGGAVVIQAVRTPRAGWAEAAAGTPTQGLLDPQLPTRFEDAEWEW
ncbi:MAG: hypothetical protein U0271_20275 [Polyangiaceae bacterium]